MSDDQYNGPEYALDWQCEERHQRSTGVGSGALKMAQENRDLLIELTGRSGRNGVIGNMRDDIMELQDWKRKADAFAYKLAAGALLGCVMGGGIVAAIMKALG